MTNKRKSYNLLQITSAVFMVVALLWLTVCAPFVYASRQDVAKQNNSSPSQTPVQDNQEEIPNDTGNSTEEKKSGNSFSEEYLHHHHVADMYFTLSWQYHKLHDAVTYNAFHGEVQVPPPNHA